MTRNDQLVWFAWSAAFLLPWLLIYLAQPALRRPMLKVSAATSVLGLTEPIFVPRYWNPPSLFDLAQRTGFDVESLIFSFAIGGIGMALYLALARRDLKVVTPAERHSGRHHLHVLALSLPYLSFLPLYVLHWNPIYPAIVALAIGAVATLACRPDLARKTLGGGLLFCGLYAAFMTGLMLLVPAYIEQVWNLPDLSGVMIGGVPIEELAFGFAFGMYWASLYEHFAWLTVAVAPRRGPHLANRTR